MAGMQETDHMTLKNGITYLLQDAKARAQLADLLVEVMEKYGPDNPPPYPVTSVNGQAGDVDIPTVDLPLPISEGGHAATTAAQAAKNLGVLPLGEVVTKITSSANLNDYVLPGVYAVSSNGIAATITNMPYQGAGTLRVFSANGAEVKAGDPWKYLIQEYVILNGRTYLRNGGSGSGTTVTWDSWRTVVNSDDFPLSITRGGTGATTAAGALENIGLKKVTVSGTTTASGALILPFNFKYNAVLSAESNSGTNYFAFHRGDGYLTCFKIVDGHLVTAPNTELSFEVSYVHR